MKFTKLLKSKKAISPIFATLILIAIAVIAGIVVYMFTSGTIASMSGGGTAAQEKVAVQAVDVSGTNVVALATATAGDNVVVTGAIIKDSQGNSVGSKTGLNIALTKGQLVSVDTGIVVPTIAGVYTVTLTTAQGGNFVSPSFTI